MLTEMKEMTFANRIRIGDKRISLDEIAVDKREHIINGLIYQPLTTIPNAQLIQTA